MGTQNNFEAKLHRGIEMLEKGYPTTKINKILKRETGHGLGTSVVSDLRCAIAGKPMPTRTKEPFGYWQKTIAKVIEDRKNGVSVPAPAPKITRSRPPNGHSSTGFKFLGVAGQIIDAAMAANARVSVKLENNQVVNMEIVK